ncbi:hypothetical protein SAMD00019534_114830 [Acytostelium subglobosum LB1]|uniref:hypothetical protein n=1 Tax=Acytostelium subglobosum LB1 TaxID=1410327 RepID=UPI000644A0EB|nr:hypothetical protein SAMD00019534_114830 [Acytostelium subglobosum LB1]GAM28307.1 hypothetical protein SAMD00019534_114830 [Acytostelium subglobosum LB1]|eukprot:XP_012748624.1 hypothetical protein SAMD00019534_114830 [Acytostelium subglobosum LB1]
MDTLSPIILQSIIKLLDPSSSSSSSSSGSSAINVLAFALTCKSNYKHLYKCSTRWLTFVNAKEGMTNHNLPSPPSSSSSFQTTWIYDVDERSRNIVPGTLPSTLTRLEMGDSFSAEINANTFPKSLLELSLGFIFDRHIAPGTLPSSITVLRFGAHFSQQLEAGSLPPCLVKLILGHEYRHGIKRGLLPKTLQYLDLGQDFQVPHSNPNLTRDMFSFNRVKREIEDGALPEGLTYLGLDDNWAIPTVLPSSIKLMRVGSVRYDHEWYDRTLPGTFEGMEWNYNSAATRNLVKGVAYLPLTCLHMSSIDHQIKPGMLPDTLKVLSLGYQFDKALVAGALPSSLTSFDMGCVFEHPIRPGDLPASLRRLVMSDLFNMKMLPGSLPPSLTELILGRCFDCKLDVGVLPPSLTKLIFGNNYDMSIGVGVLPQSLAVIKFGSSFSQPMASEAWPQSLWKLNINKLFFAGQDNNVSANATPPPPGLQSLDMYHQLDHIQYLALCTSVHTLKVHSRMKPQPMDNGDDHVDSKLERMIIPTNVKTIKLDISSQEAKTYLSMMLSDNPHVTAFRMKMYEQTFDVRILDDNRQLAVCVCIVNGLCNGHANKMTFFRLDHLLKTGPDTTFKALYPHLHEQDYDGDYDDDDDIDEDNDMVDDDYNNDDDDYYVDEEDEIIEESEEDDEFEEEDDQDEE